MYVNYLNLHQLAGALNLPKSYLRDMAEAGEIPSIMVGKNRRRFSEKDVRAALTRIGDRAMSPRRKTTLRTHHG